MDVSQTCRDFIAHVSANRWADSVIWCNGLNMYEMLRALEALRGAESEADIQSFRTALTAGSGAVNAPRMEYALSVVVDRRLPATAPGDLAATGQVATARAFLARPASILVEPIPLANVTNINTGLTAVNNALMTRLFGNPRTTYSQQCQPVELGSLRRRITSENVGRFAVTGLDSAVASLRGVITTLQRDQRLVHRVLGTAGMLCARNVRGSTTSISNHSWGTAVDLNIAGQLDSRGDNLVQFGALLLASVFNAEGWYWGAGFPTEDAMHFEAGVTLMTSWATP
jgi:hypothetical protein